jgi:uncharacterized protein
MTLSGWLAAAAAWIAGRVAQDAAPLPQPGAPPPKPVRRRSINLSSILAHRQGLGAERGYVPPQPGPFRMPPIPPWIADAHKPALAAQDSAAEALFAFGQQTSLSGLYAYGNAITNEGFLGFAGLAQLAQRPEYRHICETISREMTRKWLRFESKSTEIDKTERIKQMGEIFTKFKVRQIFEEVATHDGFFGRGHIFIDTGDDARGDPDELKTPLSQIGAKVRKGTIKGLRTVEPVWVYPNGYNASDPLHPEFYKPTSWFVMGKTVHKTRLLTFVGRELPDILKPAYSFAGMSMSQMARPYVDNWLRTRQSVSDLLHAFSIMALKTDMSTTMTGGAGSGPVERAMEFNAYRDNMGLFLLHQGDTPDGAEELTNVSAPLGTLDALQAQSQEQMSSVSGIPLVKLLGITPSGLNASTEGEIATFEDTINAYQIHLFNPKLDVLIPLLQLSEWGEIDPDITYAWEPLSDLDEKELADLRKVEADTDVAFIGAGVLDPVEVRKRLASDPHTPYAGLDVEDVPDPPGGDPGMEDGGDDPFGGGGGGFPGEPATPPPAANANKPAAKGKFGSDEFKESDHPRDDDGKFGSGGGSSTGTAAKPAKPAPAAAKPTGAAAGHLTTIGTGKTRTTAEGKPLPEHIVKMGIPPAWTDVTYSPDPDANLLVTGRDAKGRRQSLYSAKFAASQAAAKFQRVAALSREFDAVAAANDRNRQSDSEKQREAADCFHLILAMGVRPGSEDDTGADKQAYGATTLKGEHVVQEDGKTYLRFTGKKGVALNLLVPDDDTAEMLTDRAAEAGPEGQLFPSISDRSLQAYVKSFGDGGFKPKDARTLLGTTTAIAEIKKMPKPVGEAAVKKAKMEVAKIVSAKLGNTPAMALKAYINPDVFADWDGGKPAEDAARRDPFSDRRRRVEVASADPFAQGGDARPRRPPNNKFADDADFREEDHKRDEDGKFATAGASSTPSAHLSDLKDPPAWIKESGKIAHKAAKEALQDGGDPHAAAEKIKAATQLKSHHQSALYANNALRLLEKAHGLKAGALGTAYPKGKHPGDAPAPPEVTKSAPSAKKEPKAATPAGVWKDRPSKDDAVGWVGRQIADVGNNPTLTIAQTRKDILAWQKGREGQPAYAYAQRWLDHLDKLEAATPTAPAPKSLAEAMGGKSLGEQDWHSKSFAHADPATLAAMAGTRKLSSIQTGKTDAFYQRDGHFIDMGSRDKNTPDGEVIWRHEYAHAIDLNGNLHSRSFAHDATRAADGKAFSARVAPVEPWVDRSDLGSGRLQSKLAEKFADQGVTEDDLAAYSLDDPYTLRAIDALTDGKDLSKKDLDYLHGKGAPYNKHMLHDFMSAITSRQVGYGHSAEYYAVRPDGYSNEAFANYVALTSGAHGKVGRIVLHSIAPNLCKAYDKVLADVASENKRKPKP